MVILRRLCPFKQLFSVIRDTLFFACAENRRYKNTMQYSRVTERRDGIEVAWSEQKKGGEERRARRREGRGGEEGGEGKLLALC